jgi:altronate hydrolase
MTSPAPLSEWTIHLHPEDDVAVTRRALSPGQILSAPPQILAISESIPPGHKLALRAIPAGRAVRKYGQTIGFALTDIPAGGHVHTHNLGMQDFARDYAWCTAADPLPPLDDAPAQFAGFLRPNGEVGTRNYIAVISSVNCSAAVSRYVADHFRTTDFQREFPLIDGVVAFTHKSGCGILPDEPARLLQRVLAGIARHPNIGGYVLIGLGCEVTHVQQLVQQEHLQSPVAGAATPIVFTIQQVGGVRKTVEAGVAAVQRLLPAVNAARRTPQPLAKLRLALNCGGSDGNSGITANPALGVASDTLVRHGGISVLAETPEIYGAEHLLTRRAVTRAIGEKLVGFVHWWEEHTRRHGASIDNNPSPGNKDGGLTTIYEKSLGAVAKAGQAPLSAVYAYAEPVNVPGLGFMDTPGFDPVSMTGLVAGGCTVGVFTTGRGSVYGCKPAPCIKVASNSFLAARMGDDIDINAGTILDGTETVAQVGRRIFEKIVSVAGGEKTKSELAGMGDEEFAPWIQGPTM